MATQQQPDVWHDRWKANHEYRAQDTVHSDPPAQQTAPKVQTDDGRCDFKTCKMDDGTGLL